jgi:hypothetical protein
MGYRSSPAKMPHVEAASKCSVWRIEIESQNSRDVVQSSKPIALER